MKLVTLETPLTISKPKEHNEPWNLFMAREEHDFVELNHTHSQSHEAGVKCIW